MALDASARRIYARQLLLAEIGVEGQEKLLGSTASIRGGGEAASCAREYLARSGIEVVPEGGVISIDVGAPPSGPYAEAIAFVTGAWHAVEATKTALGLHSGASLPELDPRP